MRWDEVNSTDSNYTFVHDRKLLALPLCQELTLQLSLFFCDMVATSHLNSDQIHGLNPWFRSNFLHVQSVWYHRQKGLEFHVQVQFLLLRNLSYHAFGEKKGTWSWNHLEAANLIIYRAIKYEKKKTHFRICSFQDLEFLSSTMYYIWGLLISVYFC